MLGVAGGFKADDCECILCDAGDGAGSLDGGACSRGIPVAVLLTGLAMMSA